MPLHPFLPRRGSTCPYQGYMTPDYDVISHQPPFPDQSNRYDRYCIWASRSMINRASPFGNETQQYLLAGHGHMAQQGPFFDYVAHRFPSIGHTLNRQELPFGYGPREDPSFGQRVPLHTAMPGQLGINQSCKQLLYYLYQVL